jgi:hypothetical protein
MEMGELLSLRNTPSNVLGATSQEVLLVGCGHARCFGRVLKLTGRYLMGPPQNKQHKSGVAFTDERNGQ